VAGLKADTVLLFSGLDPTGGAGISADIETINQFGISALPIVTVLTAQNTQEVKLIEATNQKLIETQFKLLSEDIPFRAVKIGLLGSLEQIKTITRLLKEKSDLVIIHDPIISSGNEEKLLDDDAIDYMRNELIPMATILTPNLNELSCLAPGLDEQSAIASLNCPWILVTTTDSSEADIEHRLYHNSKLVEQFSYTKLPDKYHGSGCTLSSAISALIASDVAVNIACRRALDYTYQTLLNAKSLGKMQYHPNRNLPK
jgi:hydroxymethylpyrimidine/phosphomethylpyrimidine kinase